MDATAAVRQQAGVGRFARGLLSGLSAVDGHNDYVLVTTGSARVIPEVSDLPARHRWLRLPISERLATIAWQRMRLRPAPADLVRGADFFVTPDFALPPVGRLPAAVTVHDLSFLVHPECADDGLRRYLERTVPRSVERASVVFAVSQATASALTARLGVAPTRIAVVSNAVDQRFRPVRDEADPFGSGSVHPSQVRIARCIAIDAWIAGFDSNAVLPGLRRREGRFPLLPKRGRRFPACRILFSDTPVP